MFILTIRRRLSSFFLIMAAPSYVGQKYEKKLYVQHSADEKFYANPLG